MPSLKDIWKRVDGRLNKMLPTMRISTALEDDFNRWHAERGTSSSPPKAGRCQYCDTLLQAERVTCGSCGAAR